jgi:hypothetical protein
VCNRIISENNIQTAIKTYFIGKNYEPSTELLASNLFADGGSCRSVDAY